MECWLTRRLVPVNITTAHVVGAGHVLYSSASTHVYRAGEFLMFANSCTQERVHMLFKAHTPERGAFEFHAASKVRQAQGLHSDIQDAIAHPLTQSHRSPWRTATIECRLRPWAIARRVLSFDTTAQLCRKHPSRVRCLLSRWTRAIV